MKRLTSNIVLVWLFGCAVMIFSAEDSKIFEGGSKKRKSGQAVERGGKAQRKKYMTQYLWYTPKKQNFLQDKSGMLSCIQESQEEKEDRIWESDSKRMLEILERESEMEKNQSVLMEGSAKWPHSLVLDEENSELITIYLHRTLMDIGVSQTEKDVNPQCRGCGDPRIPWHFLRNYDFNSGADAKGRSFLTRAIFFRHKELVDLLLSIGVAINRADTRGVLPLQEAFKSDLGLPKNDEEEGMVSFLVKRGARIDSVFPF